jgi:hypothetical protein
MQLHTLQLKLALQTWVKPDDVTIAVIHVQAEDGRHAALLKA